MKSIKKYHAAFDGLDYQLQGDGSPGQVLRAIALILPPDCKILLEGSAIASDLAKRFSSLKQGANRRIHRDYISPKVPAYHLSASFDLLNELADLFDSRKGSDVADHIKLYDSQGILFSWHDICVAGWPVLFNTRLGKDVIRFLRKGYDLDIRR